VANILVRNGRRSVQFYGADGARKTLGLGKVSQKQAEAIKAKVEALCAAAITGVPPDDEVSHWLAKRDTVMLNKLARVGLVSRRSSATATLGAFLDQYVASRIDTKPATREVWGQVVRNLREHFGEQRPMRSVTAGDAEGFRLYLVGQGLAPTTVHKRLQFARQFFRMARKHRLVDDNPFDEVRTKAPATPDRQRFVTPEEASALLEACPSLDWRLIVGLSRWGGLRCPSEVLSLRWQDIDWERGRLTVTSPKTEHHPGKATREVPLFPELRPILEEGFFDPAREGAVYVVDERFRRSAMGKAGWRNCNLRTTFEKIIKRAGLTAWPRLFHNLRSSRETELAERFPIQVVTAWLGNTPDIAMRHYLQVTEEHFRLAVESESASRSAANALLQPAASPGKSATDRGKATAWGSDNDGEVTGSNYRPREELQSLATACAAHLSLCCETRNGEGGIRTLGPG